MFTREKKLIALLLTAALAFTMNTSLFAAVGAEDVATVYADTTTGPQTTASQTTEAQMSQNKLISANRMVDAYLVNYSDYVPFFGKSFKAKDFEQVLGKITISYNGQTVKVTKVKLVRLKDGVSTSYNAAIQITKTDNKDTTKAIKKLTKVNKKSKDNKLPVRIYAMNLDYAVSNNQISDLQAKGKSGKYSLKMKFASTGKKFTAKQKKDSFKVAAKKFEIVSGNLVIESGDLTGTIPQGKFENKTK